MPATDSVGRLIARGLAPVVTAHAAGGVLRRVIELAIDGHGKLPGAKAAAARQLQKHGGSTDAAIDGLIDFHIRLASAQGFVTNLGGLAVLPVALPANLAGVAMVQIRMVAAIAHLHGYDLADNNVRTALMMCLLGADVDQQIADGKLPTSPLAVATAPMFDPELDQRVSEEVVSELAGRIGGKNLALIVTRRVPLIGGGIGAVMDGWSTRQVGRYARKEFVRRRALGY